MLALVTLIQMPIMADIHDRIEYKISRAQGLLEIVNNEIIDGGECCQEVLALVTTINETTMNDLSVDQETLSIVEQILECSCVCTQINQAAINAGGGTYTITKSGEHCVTEDVTGRIVVNADCVCIDLQCHTVDAGGAANAISATGREGLKVFNGCITNSTSAAILINTYKVVEFYDLYMHDYLVDGITVNNTTGVDVHDVDFINANQGERAIWLDTVNNITVNRCNASGFLSTIGAIVQLDDCKCASVQDVDVCGNTKTASATANQFAVPTAFVSVAFSNGVDFVHVKVNNNTFNNYIPVSNQVSNWRTAEAIQFSFSNSCSLHRCETSNNIDIVGTTVDSNLDVEDFMLNLISCDNFIITEHQSNKNSCTQKITYFVGTAALNSNGVVFDGCQSNGNLAAELVVFPFASGMVVFWITSYFGASANATNSNVIRNSQANFNRVTRGGTGRTTAAPGYLFGMEVARYCDIDRCQANRNIMEDAQPFTLVLGILHGTISNSEANDNFGGQFAAGLGFNQPALELTNQSIVNCSACFNGNIGITLGNPLSPAQAITQGNLTIIDCVCKGNGGAAGKASGIILQPVTGGNTNVLIKGCQVYDTGTAFSTDVAGISVTNGKNVVIEDTEVFNTSQATQLVVTTTMLPPIVAAYTINSPRNTLPITASAVVTNPTNACTAITAIPGKIAIVLRDGACGSGTFVNNTNIGGAVATIIVTCCGTAVTNYGGTTTQTAVVVTEADGNALVAALAANPGALVTITVAQPTTGAGIYLKDVRDTKILRTELISNLTSGIRLEGNNSDVAIIECVAMNNNIGFDFTATSTASCCLVQDCRALSNKTSGFVHATSPLATTFIGNEAQCNGANAAANYVIASGVINLQELNWSLGAYSQITGSGAVLGSHFANVRAVA